MLRIALLIALLASLIFTVRQFNPAPVSPGESASARTRPEPLPGHAGLLQSPTPQEVPEIYDGYLFVEERKLEEGDFGEFGQGGQGLSEEVAVVLDQVFYSGSLIIGERRQALVVFRENTRGSIQPARTGRGRGAANQGASQAPFHNKQLSPGDRFMGYVVVAVEPEKIVFERGGEKVEKFLFDQNKKLAGAIEVSRAVPVQAPPVDLAMLNAGVESPPLTIPMVPPSGSAPSVQIVPAETATRRVRRSQRLLGDNPMPGLPTLPMPPARPVPANN